LPPEAATQHSAREPFGLRRDSGGCV